MFIHPFAYVMVATFIGAVLTMLLGVAGLSRTEPNPALGTATRTTRLMALRVGLCALLLFEIIIYLLYIKPGSL